MLVFPQLVSGATAQYPIHRQIVRRSIRSSMEDGTTIRLADTNGSSIRWRIAFRDLSDEEVTSLRAFFTLTQGNLHPFLFLDPVANLLTSSEDLSHSAWDASGL